MNPIHCALVRYIRDYTSGTTTMDGALAQRLAAFSDEQLVRHMFSSFRGGSKDTRGMRLTNFGLQLMKRYFRGYEIAMPADETLQAAHMIYLDRNATMPYYCSSDGFVLYEDQLGIKLKLADGRVATLLDIERD